MKASRQWILYTLIRVGIFAVAFALLLLVHVQFVIAAVVAALVGLCVSYIFLRGPRDAVAKSFVRIRAAKDDDHDNDVENEALDRLEQGRTKPLE